MCPTLVLNNRHSAMWCNAALHYTVIDGEYSAFHLILLGILHTKTNVSTVILLMPTENEGDAYRVAVSWRMLSYLVSYLLLRLTAT